MSRHASRPPCDACKILASTLRCFRCCRKRNSGRAAERFSAAALRAGWLRNSPGSHPDVCAQGRARWSANQSGLPLSRIWVSSQDKKCFPLRGVVCQVVMLFGRPLVRYISLESGGVCTVCAQSMSCSPAGLAAHRDAADSKMHRDASWASRQEKLFPIAGCCLSNMYVIRSGISSPSPHESSSE